MAVRIPKGSHAVLSPHVGCCISFVRTNQYRSDQKWMNHNSSVKAMYVDMLICCNGYGLCRQMQQKTRELACGATMRLTATKK